MQNTTIERIERELNAALAGFDAALFVTDKVRDLPDGTPDVEVAFTMLEESFIEADTDGNRLTIHLDAPEGPFENLPVAPIRMDFSAFHRRSRA